MWRFATVVELGSTPSLAVADGRTRQNPASGWTARLVGKGTGRAGRPAASGLPGPARRPDQGRGCGHGRGGAGSKPTGSLPRSSRRGRADPTIVGVGPSVDLYG